MAAKYFGTDGIRGRANKFPMTAEIAMRVGMAAGLSFQRGNHRHRVVLGKDTRLSGYMIENAMVAGLCAAGMDVFLLGPIPTPAVAMLVRSLRADVAFVSTSSIHGVRAFHQDQEVVQTKRLMLAAAERTYLLADHGKFGRPALHFFAALDRFDAILTGEEPPAPMRKALHEAGIRLTVTGKA